MTSRTLGLFGNSPRLFIAAAAAGLTAVAAVLPFFFPADRAEAIHPPAAVTITVGTPERLTEPGIPEGFMRFRVPITLVNPPVTIGSEFYILTTSGTFVRPVGFGGFDVIDVGGGTTYLRNFTGGLGAGTKNVAVVVDYASCGTQLFNFTAELYEDPFLNHLTARGDRVGGIDTPCDDCAGATLFVTAGPIDPNPPVAGYPATFRFTATLSKPSVGPTRFIPFFDPGDPNATYLDPVPSEIRGAETTTPSIDFDISVVYPSCATRTATLTVRAEFNTDCARTSFASVDATPKCGFTITGPAEPICINLGESVNVPFTVIITGAASLDELTDSYMASFVANGATINSVIARDAGGGEVPFFTATPNGTFRTPTMAGTFTMVVNVTPASLGPKTLKLAGQLFGTGVSETAEATARLVGCGVQFLDAESLEERFSLATTNVPPILTVESVSTSDVMFDEEGGVRIRLRGTVRDEIGDLVPGFTPVVRFVRHGDQSLPITWTPEAPSRTRPFAMKGTFDGWMSFGAPDGEAIDAISTDPNALGLSANVPLVTSGSRVTVRSADSYFAQNPFRMRSPQRAISQNPDFIHFLLAVPIGLEFKKLLDPDKPNTLVLLVNGDKETLHEERGDPLAFSGRGRHGDCRVRLTDLGADFVRADIAVGQIQDGAPLPYYFEQLQGDGFVG